MALEWVSGTAGFADLSAALLGRLATGARLPRQAVQDAAREMVARFREVWSARKGELPVPGEVVAGVDEGLSRVGW